MNLPRPSRQGVWGIAALALALAGCASSSSPGPLASVDAARLHADVAALRTAALAGRRTDAQTAAAAVRSQVAALQRAGRLSSVDAQALITVSDQVVARIPAPAASAPAQAPAPAPAPAAGPPGHKHDGHGKGPGHGGGGGGQGDGGD